MELNTADNNRRVVYSIAYKITKYHYSFIFTFLAKETTQANKEYDIFGPFWVRFGKFTDPPPPPEIYHNAYQITQNNYIRSFPPF